MITAQGARYTRTVTRDCTHLLATECDYDRETDKGAIIWPRSAIDGQLEQLTYMQAVLFYVDVQSDVRGLLVPCLLTFWSTLPNVRAPSTLPWLASHLNSKIGSFPDISALCRLRYLALDNVKKDVFLCFVVILSSTCVHTAFLTWILCSSRTCQPMGSSTTRH